MKRVILIVMDSLGIGASPDAKDFNDVGANTFGSILNANPNIKISNLKEIGFCNIDGVSCGQVKEPKGAFGRIMEMSKGKDTITGHYEIAGILTENPFKTYPDGFPKEFIEIFEEKIGCKVLGNYPASGTVIIEELGTIHEETGKPIVYTSADSVFQIAANVDVVPLERLYEICQIARELLVGKWACGRVIARPYKIVNGKRERTSDRHDYAVSPPKETILDNIKKAEKTVYAVGKIRDIFNGCGISKWVHTDDNNDGVKKTIEAMEEDFEGLIFTNLVDFDSKYGHRRDSYGYGQALEEFDNGLTDIIKSLKPDDVLMLCADHGNDPTFRGYDHTREYIPIVVYGNNIKQNVNLHTRNTFADIGATISEYLGVEKTDIGESFLGTIKK
ncbi:MAG: phosphopentomutase [Anaerovoracaceae bacterium]